MFVFISMLFVMLLNGCSQNATNGNSGGGYDAITINLPFASGDSYRCSQGPGGSYSHSGTSTRYDADFDTPNDADDPLYAPVDGVAYVHDTDADTNFGYHVNIDMGDGTYIIMAHLSSIFIDSESEVAAGQLIGFEGTTGASTGDHVHIGRHDGDAAEDGIYGTSIEGLEFSAADGTLGTSVESIAVDDLNCDLTAGHSYTSALPVALWHPDGSLVKTPSDSAVYLMEGGSARTFITESSFVSRNYSFADIALISDAELACLTVGDDITDDSEVAAVYDDEGGTGVWMLFGNESASDQRQKVSTTGWEGVLQSWGIYAASYSDLPQNSDLDNIIDRYPIKDTSALTYRDGTLVSPSDASDVYLMSNGIAMPIETWGTYLLAGFWSRSVLEVDPSEFASVVSVKGSCSTDTYCLTEADLTTCGGPEEDEGSFSAAGDLSEEEEDEGDSAAEEGEDTAIEETDDTATEEEEEIEASDTAEEATSDELTLTWETPSGVEASRITLSGEYTPNGGSPAGWVPFLASVTSATRVTYTRSMAEGDSLRFSVEFVVGSTTSWSCLAPYPAGTLQGTATATWHGVSQTVSASDDPTSDGCGLTFTVTD